MRAIPRGRPQSFKPSRSGASAERFESSQGQSGKTLALLGKTRTVPQGVRGPALHEEKPGWELGDLTRENARGPIPTTERELELMCTW
jgi:hypothetical protein